MNFADHIEIDPNIRSGKPCIKGTRITVYDILEYLAGGMSEQEILDDFPSLSHKDIQSVFALSEDSKPIKDMPSLKTKVAKVLEAVQIDAGIPKWDKIHLGGML